MGVKGESCGAMAVGKLWCYGGGKALVLWQWESPVAMAVKVKSKGDQDPIAMNPGEI